MTEGGSATATTRDTLIAIRSAFVLGASLLATWTVALLVGIVLPRYLGPELFGELSFADSFSTTFFVLLHLGMETYIQKEIPVRPEHASDFFGCSTVVRGAMTLGLLAAMEAVLVATHRPITVQRTVAIFGAAQLIVQINGTSSALLHASRKVGGLAIINVASKVIWGVGIAIVIATRTGIEGLAMAFFASEAVRAVVLWRLVREHLSLVWRVDLTAARAVLVASLPFYLNMIAITAYSKADVSVLTFVSNDAEVGWYSAAARFAGLAMLLSPLLGAVLMPLLSRAAARSEEELMEILRRAIEAILSLAIPVSLVISVGSDVWVRYVFGPRFLPAIPALTILGPIFVVTYLAIIGSTCLVLLNRPWTVLFVSSTGLVINLVANLLLVPPALRHFGEGGAGIASASIMILSEGTVTAILLGILGRRAFDRRSVATLVKSGVAAVAVALADHALRPLGPARLVVDVVLYAAIVVSTGAVRASEVTGVVKQLLERGGNRGKG